MPIPAAPWHHRERKAEGASARKSGQLPASASNTSVSYATPPATASAQPSPGATAASRARAVTMPATPWAKPVSGRALSMW